MASVLRSSVSRNLPLQAVQNWFAQQIFEPIHIDCVTTIKLKILDGKCKMNAQEKPVMAHLYHAVKHLPGVKLGEDMHEMISIAQQHNDDAMREAIYEKRVLAETMISRPVMKAFKAQIRQQGLFAEAEEVQAAVIADDADAGVAAQQTGPTTSILNLPAFQLRRQRI